MSGFGVAQAGVAEYGIGSADAISDVSIAAPVDGAVDVSPRPIVVIEIATSEIVDDARLSVTVGGIAVYANGVLNDQWTLDETTEGGVYVYTFTRIDGYFDPEEVVDVDVAYDNEDAEDDDVAVSSSFTVIGAFATDTRVEYAPQHGRIRVYFNIAPGDSSLLYNKDNYLIETLTGIAAPVQIKRIEFSEGNLYIDLFIAQRLVRFANYRLTVQNITDIYGREIS